MSDSIIALFLLFLWGLVVFVWLFGLLVWFLVLVSFGLVWFWCSRFFDKPLEIMGGIEGKIGSFLQVSKCSVALGPGLLDTVTIQYKYRLTVVFSLTALLDICHFLMQI